ncbi:MAG: hypothetical protein LCH26_01330 [Proteobacteria bacterium]|nr:hypothetical protein [Pseudomonadota bacterium]
MYFKCPMQILAATCLWNTCTQAVPFDVNDPDRSHAASSVPVGIVDTNNDTPEAVCRGPAEMESCDTNQEKLLFKKNSYLEYDLDELIQIYDFIDEKNTPPLVKLAKDALNVVELLRAAREVTLEKLILIANAGFVGAAHIAVLKAPFIHEHNVSRYVRIFERVTNPRYVQEILDASIQASDERVNIIVGAQFPQEVMAKVFTDSRITKDNAKSYAVLLNGVSDTDTFLQATEHVHLERLAFIAAAGFEPKDRVCALRADQITAQNAKDYVRLLMNMYQPDKLLEAAEGVSDERLAFIAAAGFEPDDRACALRADQITAQNAKDYALLLKNGCQKEWVLKVAKGLPDERIALIATARFEPSNRLFALRAAQITAQNVNIYVRLSRGLLAIDELLEAAEDVSDERLALIAAAGFEPSARAHALRAQHITAQNVNIYVRLLKGEIRMPSTILGGILESVLEGIDNTHLERIADIVDPIQRLQALRRAIEDHAGVPK